MARPKSSRANLAPTQLGLPPGLVLADKYVVERTIGEGGMAFVVAARHRELDELVAIKFLKPDQQNEEVVRRFAREAKAMARLRSQYITRIHDVGMSKEHGPYIVMELLHGEDVGSTLERLGPLSIENAVDITLQAASALAEAHARGIVHRDVKPENMFLNAPHGNLDRATVKLVDFGVSKASLSGTTFGTSVEFAKTTTLVGSPLYMAPEQIRGSDSVDHRADIWSLGVVFYELLTNNSPFVASSITELSARILETEPHPLLDLRSDAPPELEDVLHRCLAKKVDDRYQSMAELAEALSPFASAPYAHLAASMPPVAQTIAGGGLAATGERLSMVESGSRKIPDRTLSSTANRLSASSSRRTGPGSPSPRATGAELSSSRPSGAGLSSSRPSGAEAAPAQPAGRSAVALLAVALLAVAAVAAVFLLRPREAPVVAASAPAAASAALVEFRSEPAGAAVEVDGQGRGVTPLKVSLAPGSRSVRLALTGYEPFSMIVPVPSIGEVPPLPVVTLRPGATATASAAATPDAGPAPTPDRTQGGTRPAVAARPAVEQPDPPKTAPPTTQPAQPTSRPRLIDERSNVKVIE